MSSESKDVLAFGPYRVDREQRVLSSQGTIIPLAPKLFDTLLALVESEGRILDKDNLLKKVWPDAFVEEGSLSRNISTLRRVLGESPGDQRYIVTVPKRGYRFVAQVTTNQANGAPAGQVSISPTDEPRAPESTFVGRERETERMADHFARMRNGTGKVVFVAGEAGIGKSSLAEEFMQSMQDLHPGLILARGRAVEQYGTGEAYLPFLDALEALLRSGCPGVTAVLRAHAPTWCLQLPAFVSASSSSDLARLHRETAGATKDRMLREMGDALGALSQKTSLLILLEDLHWADPSTVDLLRYLGSRMAAQRVLLLATFRPEDVQIANHPLKNCRIEMQAHQQCDEITLDMLGADDIVHLIDARFHPNRFPAEFAGLVRNRTDGQPLFTVSLLEFLARRGDLAPAGADWTLATPLGEMGLEIPDTVREMIRKKSAALDPESRLALQYASVEGEEFLSAVLAGLLNRDEIAVEEQLATLAATHRLIVRRGEEELPDGLLTTRYAFAHALYQNVFYEELVAKRREMLHAHAGEQLLRHYGERAPRIAAQLAVHFERGRNWPRAIEFLLLAGANAGRLFANLQAAGHYTRALSVAGKLPPETRAETEFRIYEKRAAAYLSSSRFEDSIADCREMTERARAIGCRESECLALYSLGFTLFWAHRLHEMQSVLEEVLRLAGLAQSEPARLKAMALMAQGDQALGALESAARRSQEVIDHAAMVDRRTLLGVLDVQARLRFFQSEYGIAERMFRDNLDLATELEDNFEMLKAQYFLSLTLANLGRISESLEVLNRVTEMARRNRDLFWSTRVPNCFGWIHRELQDFEAATAFDREGAETAHRLGVGEAQVNSVINLVSDLNHSGDEAGIRSAVQTAESMLHVDPWFRWRFEIRLRAARAEQTLSRPEALCLLETATRYCARKYMVTAHTLLTKIAMAEGDDTDAEAHIQAALEILRRYPAPLVAWKVHLLEAHLQTQLGRAGDAHAALRDAASTVNLIARNITDDRLRSVFLSSPQVQEALTS